MSTMIRPTSTASVPPGRLLGARQLADAVTARPPGARGIDEILAAARGRLLRLTPQQAWRELAEGAALIDIRPAAQRAEEGEIPGSAIVERNHLEWRLDPGCDARLPWVTGYDHRIIVICHEGYTSSLAAAVLHDLGLRRATDVIGGFRAWTAAGLPSAPARAVSQGRLMPRS